MSNIWPEGCIKNHLIDDDDEKEMPGKEPVTPEEDDDPELDPDFDEIWNDDDDSENEEDDK